MKEYSIQNLLKGSVKAFAEQPEVAFIYSFGSIPENQSDKFSDVDLTIITNDVETTSKDIKNIASKIDDVLTIFVLFESDTSSAYTIFFKNFSFYQKLDVGFVSSEDVNLFKNSRLEYSNDTATEPENTKVVSLKESELDHRLLDVCIGSLRYLKYMERKEIWNAYKFYKSFMECYIKYIANLPVEANMDIESYKKIQKVLGTKYTDLLFLPKKEDMSQTYLKYLEKYFQQQKDHITRENVTFIRRILEFWHETIQ